MSDISTAIGEAARWLRECHDWMLANDLDGGCPMTANPLDLAEGLEALTTRLAPDRKERAREAAEAWRIPANSDGTGELVKPRDHCVWGFEQGYLAALTPATAPDREAIAREVKEALRGDYTDRGMEDAFFRWPIIERAILSLMGEG